ncbi:hypothetical protein P168DRAFT_65712 [Aspergillus campestris IBT 28561]|uniref:Uncharacterized protein n=1 Tax=Aspergillus campestris (strain IBT 28561) TaxID=1392248 RepID=A0A2I1CTA1_ASPC2|nr:uncharacterized protein P168DRAFT_65712 [Aspergillus campestris IBT 28561]PKY00860.1 hypothetical protein P168DRAFT_65712 [Aspergillus campestris IBT 28561]
MEPFRSVCEPSSLTMIFASLGDIHATRHQKTGRHSDLKEAISATRLALRSSASDDPLSQTLSNNLGSLLLRCHLDLGEQDDLDLALYYTRQALDSISVDDKRFPLVLTTIGTVHATRYDRQGDFADLEVAICKIQESLELRPMDETLHISLFNNLGALLWRRYRLTGRPLELDDSILYLSKALEGISENTTERVACLINCGFAFVRRYRLVEQLGDLDSALRHAREVMQLDPDNHRLGILLSGLDTFLEHRRDHTLPQRAAKGSWFRMPAVPGSAILLTYLLLMALCYWMGISPSILLTLTTFLGGAVVKWVVDQYVFRGGGNPNFPRPPFASVLRTGKATTTGSSKADDYFPKILPAPLIAVTFSSSLRGSRKLDDRREQPREQSLEQRPAQKHQNRLTKHWRSLNVTRIDQGCRDSRGTYSDRRYLYPESHSTSTHRILRRNSRTDITFAGEHVETGQGVLETARREPCLSTIEAGLLPQRLVPSQEPSDFSTSPQEANTAYESDHEEDQPQLLSQVQVPEPPQRDTKDPAPVDILGKRDESSSSPKEKTQPLQESDYPEHRIWHDVPSSGTERASFRRTNILYQGDTTHKMATNKGLAMGNVSGKRTEVVGHSSYGDTRCVHKGLYGVDRTEPTEPNHDTSSTLSKSSGGCSYTSINSSPFQESMSEDDINSPPRVCISDMEGIDSDVDEKEDQPERILRPVHLDVSPKTLVEENEESEYGNDYIHEERRDNEQWDKYSEHDRFGNKAPVRELDRYSLSAEEGDAEDEAKKALVDDSVRAYMESLGLEM